MDFVEVYTNLENVVQLSKSYPQRAMLHFMAPHGTFWPPVYGLTYKGRKVDEVPQFG